MPLDGKSNLRINRSYRCQNRRLGVGGFDSSEKRIAEILDKAFDELLIDGIADARILLVHVDKPGGHKRTHMVRDRGRGKADPLGKILTAQGFIFNQLDATINKADEIEKNAFLCFDEEERGLYLSLFKRHIDYLKSEEKRVLDSIPERWGQPE